MKGGRSKKKFFLRSIPTLHGRIQLRVIFLIGKGGGERRRKAGKDMGKRTGRKKGKKERRKEGKGRDVRSSPPSLCLPLPSPSPFILPSLSSSLPSPLPSFSSFSSPPSLFHIAHLHTNGAKIGVFISILGRTKHGRRRSRGGAQSAAFVGENMPGRLGAALSGWRHAGSGQSI